MRAYRGKLHTTTWARTIKHTYAGNTRRDLARQQLDHEIGTPSRVPNSTSIGTSVQLRFGVFFDLIVDDESFLSQLEQSAGDGDFPQVGFQESGGVF